MTQVTGYGLRFAVQRTIATEIFTVNLIQQRQFPQLLAKTETRDKRFVRHLINRNFVLLIIFRS